ncbi:MAG TPA: hypothetical protein VEY93_07360, partial [Longimicrobium sp.]|nr:hypothetical protein [Longimicrobium sp.]
PGVRLFVFRARHAVGGISPPMYPNDDTCVRLRLAIQRSEEAIATAKALVREARELCERGPDPVEPPFLAPPWKDAPRRPEPHERPSLRDGRRAD